MEKRKASLSGRVRSVRATEGYNGNDEPTEHLEQRIWSRIDGTTERWRRGIFFRAMHSLRRPCINQRVGMI
jgi:hypothetical protein